MSLISQTIHFAHHWMWIRVIALIMSSKFRKLIELIRKSTRRKVIGVIEFLFVFYDSKEKK